MTDDELFEVLKSGAVVRVSDSTGEVTILSHDDISPDMRECIRINQKDAKMFAGRASAKPTTPEELAFTEELRQHRASCPICLESYADYLLLDAAWLREEADSDPIPYPDGTYRTPEQHAAVLEAKAADLWLRAAEVRAARAKA